MSGGAPAVQVRQPIPPEVSSTVRRPTKAVAARQQRAAVRAVEEWMDQDGLLRNYAPQRIEAHEWAAIRPFVLDCVSATDEATLNTVKLRLRVTARHVAWCRRHGFPLDPEAIFTEDMVEAFCAADPVFNQGKGTLRSALRSVARANTRKAIWTPTPRPRRKTALQPPTRPPRSPGTGR